MNVMTPEQIQEILEMVEYYANSRIEQYTYMTARATLLDIRDGREGDAYDLAQKAYGSECLANGWFDQIRAKLNAS
jgi:hypothetical protein